MNYLVVIFCPEKDHASYHTVFAKDELCADALAEDLANQLTHWSGALHEAVGVSPLKDDF